MVEVYIFRSLSHLTLTFDLLSTIKLISRFAPPSLLLCSQMTVCDVSPWQRERRRQSELPSRLMPLWTDEVRMLRAARLSTFSSCPHWDVSKELVTLRY